MATPTEKTMSGIDKLREKLAIKSLDITKEEYNVLLNEIYEGSWPGTPRENEINRARTIVSKRKEKSHEKRIASLETKVVELTEMLKELCEKLFEDDEESDKGESDDVEYHIDE